MSDSEEKILPPTQRKLREARRRGEIARSKELVTALATAGGLLALVLLGPSTIARLTHAIDEAGRLQDRPLNEAAMLIGVQLQWVGIGIVGPLLLLVLTSAVLASVLSNGGFAFSATPLLPKFERIDPVKGFGRLFALRSLIELAKGMLKLGAVVSVCVIMLRSRISDLMLLPSCGVSCVPGLVAGTLIPLLGACCAVFFLVGIIDIGLQRWLFHRDMRMTRTEHKRDRKDAEGDPRLLAHRKKERRERAQLGARTSLKHATFLIESADQLLAFRYAPPDASVPLLVARRQRQASQQLASEARRFGLTTVFDPEAVEAIGKRLEVGKMIPKTAFGPIIRCMRDAGVI